jgi:imidazolonepropionase-like amidohydrolase
MTLRKKLISGFVLLAAFMAAGIAAFDFAYTNYRYAAQAGPPADIIIHGGMLFDGTSTEPTENFFIVAHNGLITCVGATCDVPEKAIKIDATGRAILPGLIDLHDHFFGYRNRPSLPKLIWNTALLKPDFRRAMLEAGVTTFRSVGDPQDIVLELRNMLDRRELAGPRMFVAGPIFTAPGGHPAYGGRDPNPSGFGGNMAFQSDNPTQVVAEIALLKSKGVDGIKAVYQDNTAASIRVGIPTLSLGTLQALINAARSHGLWVAVHAGPGDETKEAVRAGATTIEHGVRNGHLIDDETLRTLVANDVIYVPTLGREPEGHLNIPALVGAGVKIGVGTDGEDYHQELWRLADAGMSPPAVLLAATINGATALRKTDTLGTVETGKIADLVIVNGAPWRDIQDLRSTMVVIQAGHIVLDRR